MMGSGYLEAGPTVILSLLYLRGELGPICCYSALPREELNCLGLLMSGCSYTL